MFQERGPNDFLDFLLFDEALDQYYDEISARDQRLQETEEQEELDRMLDYYENDLDQDLN